MIQNRVFKAPGKVLLAGGYGVLEHQNVGLSLAVECYFYSTFSISPSSTLTFTVHSRQISLTWKYQYSPDHQLTLLQGTENKYLSSSIQTSLHYFNQFRGKQLPTQQITIDLIFDKGFLSAPNTQQPSPKFLTYQDASKQGLGSSACVVVSIVNIICHLLGQSDTSIIRSLSHISNLRAQGKIGSNFDISTAIFGTQLYTNILPKHALDYIATGSKNTQVFQTKTDTRPLNPITNYDILLVDLFKGSNTVKMVSGFLTRLEGLSREVQARFFQESRELTLDLYNTLNSEELNKAKLKEINFRHRKLQQEYGTLTDTEIEPQSLREQIDELMECEDVLYIICPGSGGYDAVAILVEKGKNLPTPLKYTRYPLSQLGLQTCNEPQSTQITQYIFGLS